MDRQIGVVVVVVVVVDNVDDSTSVTRWLRYKTRVAFQIELNCSLSLEDNTLPASRPIGDIIKAFTSTCSLLFYLFILFTRIGSLRIGDRSDVRTCLGEIVESKDHFTLRTFLYRVSQRRENA